MFTKQSKRKKTIKGVARLLSVLLLFCFFAGFAAEEKTTKSAQIATELNKLTLKKELKNFKKEVTYTLTVIKENRRTLCNRFKCEDGKKLSASDYKKAVSFFKETEKFLEALSEKKFDHNAINSLYDNLKTVLPLFEEYLKNMTINGNDDVEIQEYFNKITELVAFLRSYKNEMESFIAAYKNQVPWVNKVDAARGFAKDKEASTRTLKFTAGFVGNKAGEGDNLNELYKIDINVDVSYNDYPSFFNFNSETGIQLSEGKLDENVNALTLSYGYDINNWFGVNGFVSRSSNSYLSIQHRYEMGAGVTIKLMNILSRSDREIIKSAEENLAALGTLETFIKNNSDFSSKRKGTLMKELNAVKKAGKRKVKAKKKNLARFTLGFDAAIMSEIEKAAISSEVSDSAVQEAENETQTFELDGEHHFRFLVTPFFMYTTGKTLTVTGQWRWVLPFLGEWKTDDGKVGDYRNTLKFQIAIKLPQNPDKSVFKKVSLILEYQRSFDNIAPIIPESAVVGGTYPDSDTGVLKYGTKTILVPYAADSYDKYGLKISIEF